MRLNRIRTTISAALVAVVALPTLGWTADIAHAVPPPAPTQTAPVNGASVTIPATISWSPVAGAGGYNWEISLSSAFTTVIERNSSLLVGAATTQDIVSGLAN